MSKIKIILLVIFIFAVTSLFAVEIYALAQLSIESGIDISYSTDGSSFSETGTYYYNNLGGSKRPVGGGR